MTASAAPARISPRWISSATLLAQGEVEAVLILSPDRLARQFAYQYMTHGNHSYGNGPFQFITSGRLPEVTDLEEPIGGPRSACDCVEQ